MAFRSCYKLCTNNAIRWFPGHMAKGIKQMEQRLKSIDCIIEVHDARIPFSGRNAQFQKTICAGGVKPHILVLNKKDFTEIRDQRRVAKELQEREGVQHVIFTNCKDQKCRGLKELMPLVVELITSAERYNRNYMRDYCAMVIGVPNVGKSSLLNVMRNRHLKKKGAARVGALAGVTRSVMEKIKISEDPLVYMVDTPGILEPRIDNDEMGMKLSLVGCLPEQVVGEDQIADYLLYWLNRHHRFEYVEKMLLDAPCDNIGQVLFTYASAMHKFRKVKKMDGQHLLMPDILTAARHFIDLFRTGELGPANLDHACTKEPYVSEVKKNVKYYGKIRANLI